MWATEGQHDECIITPLVSTTQQKNNIVNVKCSHSPQSTMSSSKLCFRGHPFCSLFHPSTSLPVYSSFISSFPTIGIEKGKVVSRDIRGGGAGCWGRLLEHDEIILFTCLLIFLLRHQQDERIKSNIDSTPPPNFNGFIRDL